MGIKGTFGYIISKQKYLTHVQYDADLLFDILIRELFILMNKYGSIEALQIAFEKIKIIDFESDEPTSEDIENCKYFTDLNVSYKSTNDWYCLLRGCQSSFINLIEAGYINNQSDEYGFVVILDFDKKVLVSSGDFDYKSISIEEIMTLEDMPTKTYDEIICELKERYENNNSQLQNIDDIINKSEALLKKTDDINIINKINRLLDEAKFKKSKINMKYNLFRERLKALNMIKE